MKRTRIIKEYERSEQKGTLGMKDQKSFLCSQIMEIEDLISIDNSEIIWENNTLLNEQLSGSLFPGILQTQNLGLLKKNNQSLSIDLNQTPLQKREHPKYIGTVQYKEILKNYFLARIKEARTFEDVLVDDVLNKNIDLSIIQYIENNILPRVKFHGFELFVEYFDSHQTGNALSPVIWDVSIQGKKAPNTRIDLDENLGTMKFFYNQEKTATRWCWRYYFNLSFKKK